MPAAAAAELMMDFAYQDREDPVGAGMVQLYLYQREMELQTAVVVVVVDLLKLAVVK